MPAQFKQPEISVRESINSLSQHGNLAPKETDTGTDTGTDIGGGETLWGDGSITGGNSNGTYTKWPNGELDCNARSVDHHIVAWSIAGARFRSTSPIDIFFPYEFFSPEYTFAGIVNQSSNRFTVNLATSDLDSHTTEKLGVFLATDLQVNTSLDIRIMVKGRWK